MPADRSDAACTVADAWLMVSWQSPRLIIQMEMSSLLTLDAIDRAIGDFLCRPSRTT
jgi:hypothetical protein